MHEDEQPFWYAIRIPVYWRSLGLPAGNLEGQLPKHEDAGAASSERQALPPPAPDIVKDSWDGRVARTQT